MVSNLSIFFIAISLAVTLLLPIAVFVYTKKKFGVGSKAVWVGVLMFVVFAQMLEGLLHTFTLNHTRIMSQPYLYMLYSGLAAGVLEEVGRYIGFAVLLKGQTEWKDGISYGIGQGGAENFLVGGAAFVQFLLFAQMLNHGTFGSLSSKLPEDALLQLRHLLTGPSSYFLIAGAERIFAFVFHLALSLIVLYAVKKGEIKYLLFAIILHAVLDFPAALYQVGKVPMWSVEVIAFICSAVLLWVVMKMKKVMENN